jgi:glutathione peroxidase-family protein
VRFALDIDRHLAYIQIIRERETDMKITYFADDTSMGDNSPEDCNLFRRWAKEQLQAAYPEHEIEVSDKPSLRQFSTNDFDNEDEIGDFCSRLWAHCPWDWQ